MASLIPREVKKEIATNWIQTENWYACLLTSAFVYAAGTHILYTDVVGSEVVGTGYTAEGELFAKDAWGAGSGWDVDGDALLNAADVPWVNATFADVKYIVVYEFAGKKIRAIYELPVAKTVTSGTFTIQWNALGLIKISS